MPSRISSRNNNPHLVIPQDTILTSLDKERGLLLLELRKQCKEHRITQKEICLQLGLPKNFFKKTYTQNPKNQKYQRNKEPEPGYVKIVVPKGTVGAPKSGLMLKHRKIMSDYLGRPLEKWEVVHHKNRIKNDNRIENLELLNSADHPTCKGCPFYLELQRLKKKYPQGC